MKVPLPVAGHHSIECCHGVVVKIIDVIAIRIVNEQYVFADEVDVLGVDFEVEDGVGGGGVW